MSPARPWRILTFNPLLHVLPIARTAPVKDNRYALNQMYHKIKQDCAQKLSNSLILTTGEFPQYSQLAFQLDCT